MKKKYFYYEIKVSIRDVHPPVWRRLRIPSNITFHKLAAILELSFGWCGYHLYEFEVGATLHEMGTFIKLPDIYDDDLNQEVLNSKEENIDDYFNKYNRLKFIYDFGDDWIHDIIIENVVEVEEEFKYPICIKAKMANLPEDCGGPYGYDKILKVLSNPKSRRYSEIKNWLEETCFEWNDDRTFFDIETLNLELEDYEEHAKLMDGEIPF